MRKEEAQKVERKDYSVFEYCSENEDLPPASYKRIRVDKLRKLTSGRSPSAYASLAKDINATIKAKLGLLDCKEGALTVLAGLEKASFELTEPTLGSTESIENTKGQVIDHSNDCNVEADNSTFVVNEPNHAQNEVNDLARNEVDLLGPEPSRQRQTKRYHQKSAFGCVS